MQELFPSQTEYIHGELIPTMEYWTEFYNVWCCSFGLRSSALQEGLNWTLKAPLNKQTIPLQAFPQYQRKAMLTRQWKIDRKVRTKKSLSNLVESLTSFNFVEVLKVLAFSVSFDARYYLLGEFEAAQQYQVAPVAFELVQGLLEDIQNRRGSSCARFGLILKLEQARFGRFFVVTSNHNTRDVVYAGDCFACTCGDCFEMASPDRHIFACYRNGFVEINTLAHIHPVMWSRGDLHLLDFNTFSMSPPDAVLKEDCVRALSSGSPLGIVKMTESLWKVEGCGVNPAVVSAVIAFSGRGKTLSAGMDRQERSRKMFYELLPVMMKDEDMFLEFTQLYIRNTERRKEAVVLAAKANGVVASRVLQPPSVVNGSKSRKKSYSNN